MTFYAYIHAKPNTVDATGVFYVGKGRDARGNPLPARNRYHGFVLAKHGAENILTSRIECSDEETAFELERGLIKCLRRADAPLTNMTDGGEGAAGYKVTPEQKERAKASMHERYKDEAYREKVADQLRAARKRTLADPEKRAAQAASMRGVKKTMSEAAIAARRANALKAQTPEARAKRAEKGRLRWQRPEEKAKVAEKMRQRWLEPERREAMLKDRPEGIAKSWQDESVRNKRIRGIKASANSKKEGS